MRCKWFITTLLVSIFSIGTQVGEMFAYLHYLRDFCSCSSPGYLVYVGTFRGKLWAHVDTNIKIAPLQPFHCMTNIFQHRIVYIPFTTHSFSPVSFIMEAALAKPENMTVILLSSCRLFKRNISSLTCGLQNDKRCKGPFPWGPNKPETHYFEREGTRSF